LQFKKLEEIDLFKMFQNWDKLDKKIISIDDHIYKLENKLKDKKDPYIE
jgi:hypothetical protein